MHTFTHPQGYLAKVQRKARTGASTVPNTAAKGLLLKENNAGRHFSGLAYEPL
jgi:hypothetical protein